MSGAGVYMKANRKSQESSLFVEVYSFPLKSDFFSFRKLLRSIPSCDILFYTEAGFVDITDVVKPVTLILTPEILFVIGHEEDIQQQTFAVAELECGVKMQETAVLTIVWRDSFTEKLEEVGSSSFS